MIDHRLDEFVQKLKAAGADNLKAVILYGSAATEEFHTKHSDLNILCIVAQTDAAKLEALHEPVQWWIRRGQRPPLVFTLEELCNSADIFTIELMDMKWKHRILFGENVLADFSVPLHYHSLQVERELRINWLRLRQAVLAAPKKSKTYLELMTSSFSTFVALFRHALIALGEPRAETMREAIERIAKWATADPSGFLAILRLREGKTGARDIEVEKTLNQYFMFVEAATDKFDKQLDANRNSHSDSGERT